MTGIEQHHDLTIPITHQHHHLIKQPPAEAMSSTRLTSNHPNTDPASTRDETHNQVHDPTPAHPHDPCPEHHLSKGSMSRIRSFQNLQQLGSSKVSRETTLNDPSPIISSNSDSRIHSSPPESKSLSSNPAWKFESPASPSATTATSSRKIYNKWLNKEVPYTTMQADSSSSHTRSPCTTKATTSSHSTKPTTTTDPPSSTATTNRLNRTWDMSHSPSSTCPATTARISTSSHDLTFQTPDEHHPKRKSTSSSRCTEQTPADSRLNKNIKLTLHPRHPNEAHHPSGTRRPDSSPRRKFYSSDSNLASSCTEETRQNLLKTSSEVPAYSRDSSRETACKSRSRSHPAPPAHHPAKPCHQRRLKEQRKQLHQLLQLETEENPQPRAALNRSLAETLWGKQLEVDENQTLCRNSLPRQSLASEAKSKLRVDLKAELDDVEIEIQDILAQPLVAEITISSPSLFDETSSGQSSSSPPITVQTLYH